MVRNNDKNIIRWNNKEAEAEPTTLSCRCRMYIYIRNACNSFSFMSLRCGMKWDDDDDDDVRSFESENNNLI